MSKTPLPIPENIRTPLLKYLDAFLKAYLEIRNQNVFGVQAVYNLNKIREWFLSSTTCLHNSKEVTNPLADGSVQPPILLSFSEALIVMESLVHTGNPKEHPRRDFIHSEKDFLRVAYKLASRSEPQKRKKKDS